METTMKINMDILYGIVEEYMVSCETYHNHRREEHKEHYGETYSSWQHWYGVYSREMDTNCRGLSDICDMLGFEMDSLVSIVKSIHRHEKAIGWERCFDVSRHRDSFLYNVKEIDLFDSRLSTFRTAPRDEMKKIWQEFICLTVKGWLP